MLLCYLSMLDTENDKLKFEKLYYEYRGLMKYIALDILKNRVLAEDAVHDAFEKLANYTDKIGDVYSEQTKGFIITVIKSIACDIYRREKKQRIFIQDETDIYNIVDIKSSEAMEAKEVVLLLKDMPEIYRDVLALKVCYGFSYKEIAHILGITSESARKRLERGKKYLKEMWGTEDDV